MFSLHERHHVQPGYGTQILASGSAAGDPELVPSAPRTQTGALLPAQMANGLWVIEHQQHGLPHAHLSPVSSVSYLFKYVFKGSDSATVALQRHQPQQDQPVPLLPFVDTRSTPATEAYTHFFGYHGQQ